MLQTNTTATSSNTITQNGCSICLVKFESKEAKRDHMKEEWHVYNLKRHIASLPPISFTVFDTQVRISEPESEESGSEKHCEASERRYKNGKAWHAHPRTQTHRLSNLHSNDELQSGGNSALSKEESFSTLSCLFCNVDSSSLDTNLTHMSHAHSFFIPDIEHLIDISSFLSYLHKLISVFHECLFCGCERSSKAGAQDHMRGKGHCKIDFGGEDELREFWEFDDDSSDGDMQEDREKRLEHMIGVSEDELRLPSGKILGHRSSHGRYLRQHRSRSERSSSPQDQLLLTKDRSEEDFTSPESKHQSLVRRKGTEMSMIGVSELQQRALMAVEKKMEELHARARNEYQAGVDRGGNLQKRYKVPGIGKKRGGLEKRNG